MAAIQKSSTFLEREDSTFKTLPSFSKLSCTKRPIRSRASSVSSLQSKNEKSTQRKSTSLPSETVEYLKAWMMSPEHIAHPYPTEQEKCQIMVDTGIELKQLTNWFVNNRKRYWKPRVEAQLKQRLHQQTTTHLIPALTNKKKESDLTSRIVSVPTAEIFFPVHSKRAHNSSFVYHSNAVSDCSHSTASSCESEQLNTSNDEVCEHNEKTHPDSISFIGETEDSKKRSFDDMNYLHREEIITCHILRPCDKNILPSLEDVSILSNVPAQCILKTFFDCSIEYDISYDIMGNQKEIQNVRDTAVMEMKEKKLNLYLQSLKNKNDRVYIPNSLGHSEQSEHEYIQDHQSPIITKRLPKRPRSVTEGSPLKFVSKDEPEERSLYHKKDTKKWRDLCSNARNFFDEQLPTLEEAMCMFGYS